ncbi:MAG TPA: hypothetical protein VF760_11165, partial [Xanthobacteraceae bacterium]
MTKFAAALLATSLIAGSAIAAQPSGMPASNGAAPAVQTQTPATPAAKTVKPANSVKHVARHRNHARKHLARSKGRAVHHVRHANPAKTH